MNESDDAAILTMVVLCAVHRATFPPVKSRRCAVPALRLVVWPCCADG